MPYALKRRRPVVRRGLRGVTCADLNENDWYAAHGAQSCGPTDTACVNANLAIQNAYQAFWASCNPASAAGVNPGQLVGNPAGAIAQPGEVFVSGPQITLQQAANQIYGNNPAAIAQSFPTPPPVVKAPVVTPPPAPPAPPAQKLPTPSLRTRRVVMQSNAPNPQTVGSGVTQSNGVPVTAPAPVSSSCLALFGANDTCVGPVGILTALAGIAAAGLLFMFAGGGHHR